MPGGNKRLYHGHTYFHKTSAFAAGFFNYMYDILLREAPEKFWFFSFKTR